MVCPRYLVSIYTYVWYAYEYAKYLHNYYTYIYMYGMGMNMLNNRISEYVQKYIRICLCIYFKMYIPAAELITPLNPERSWVLETLPKRSWLLEKLEPSKELSLEKPSCTLFLGLGNVQTIMSCIRLREHPMPKPWFRSCSNSLR